MASAARSPQGPHAFNVQSVRGEWVGGGRIRKRSFLAARSKGGREEVQRDFPFLPFQPHQKATSSALRVLVHVKRPRGWV